MASEWSAPRHDSANTGANLTAVAPTGDVGPRWTARVGTGGMSAVGPTVANGTVYVGPTREMYYERLELTLHGPQNRWVLVDGFASTDGASTGSASG